MLDLAQERETCLRCDYARADADEGPDYACPKCGAVYARMWAARKANEQARELELERERLEEQRFALQRQLERERERAGRRPIAQLVSVLYSRLSAAFGRR